MGDAARPTYYYATKHVALHLSRRERSLGSAGTGALRRLREARSEEGSFAVHLRLRLPPKTCDITPKDTTSTITKIVAPSNGQMHTGGGKSPPRKRERKKGSSRYVYLNSSLINDRKTCASRQSVYQREPVSPLVLSLQGKPPYLSIFAARALKN